MNPSKLVATLHPPSFSSNELELLEVEIPVGTALGDIERGDFYVVTRSGHSGAQGSVCRAEHALTKRTVAIKAPKGLSALHAPQELAALQRVKSGWVVELVSVIEWWGRKLFVLEWLEGDSLHCSMNPGCSIIEGVRIAKDLVMGLADIHSVGVAHGDMSPANVVHDAAEQRWKVCDLGLAVLPETVQHGGGTPGYLAPELRSEPHTPRDACTDIYATGVMLSELLLGRKAHSFLSEAPSEILASIEDPCVPGALRRILQRCLAVDRLQRYENAIPLRADLEVAFAELALEEAFAELLVSKRVPRGAGDHIEEMTLHSCLCASPPIEHWSATLLEGQRVDLWLLPLAERHNREAIRAFHDQVSRVAKVQHPALPAVIGYGVSFGFQHFAAMKRRSVRVENKYRSVADVEEWALQLVGAVGAMHTIGLSLGTVVLEGADSAPVLVLQPGSLSTVNESATREDFRQLAQVLTSAGRSSKEMSDVLKRAVDGSFSNAKEFMWEISRARDARLTAEAHAEAERRASEARRRAEDGERARQAEESARLISLVRVARQSRKAGYVRRLEALIKEHGDPLDDKIDEVTAYAWQDFVFACGECGILQGTIDLSVRAVAGRRGLVQGDWMNDSGLAAFVSACASVCDPHSTYVVAAVIARRVHIAQVQDWIVERHALWLDEQPGPRDCRGGVSENYGTGCDYCGYTGAEDIPIDSSFCQVVRPECDLDRTDELQYCVEYEARTREIESWLRRDDRRSPFVAHSIVRDCIQSLQRLPSRGLMLSLVERLRKGVR